jgi:hypothetical protein
MYDGKDLVVQKLVEAESINLETDILIEVQHWSPLSNELGTKKEIFIRKDTTIGEFRVLISQKFQIPLQFVGVAKPRTFQLKELSQLATLAWEVADNWPLSGTPWHVQDGYVVLVVVWIC